MQNTLFHLVIVLVLASAIHCHMPSSLSFFNVLRGVVLTPTLAKEYGTGKLTDAVADVRRCQETSWVGWSNFG